MSREAHMKDWRMLLFDEDYRKLFRELLASHSKGLQKARNGSRQEGMEWCAFWPHVGSRYKEGGLFFVGRALNGWDSTAFSLADAVVPARAEEICKRCASTDPKTGQWMDSYANGRNRFLLACKLTAEGLGYSPWYENVVWSNMMRVSPKNGGNPETWSCEAQLPKAADLLSFEIARLKPRAVVLVTDAAGLWNWATTQLMHHLRVTDVNEHDRGPVRCTAAVEGTNTRIIVPDRPDRRGRTRQWVEDTFAPEVIRILK
jgi:hypothetical protein